MSSPPFGGHPGVTPPSGSDNVIDIFRTFPGDTSFSKNMCSGRRTSPLISWHFIECQQNITKFLSDVNCRTNYCTELCDIIQNKTSLRQDSLLGFFLKSNRKTKINKTVDAVLIPLALLYKAKDDVNSYWIQSFDCVLNNEECLLTESCKICKLFWRSFRGLSPGPTISMKEHKKIVNRELSDIKISNTLNKKKIENKDEIIKEKNKMLNRLRKKIHYWKNRFIDVESAVAQWREVEFRRNGFIKVNDDEALKWFQFYDFIDQMIEKEHEGDPEKIALHKELIRTETEHLGKYNKNGNKTGIRSTKISSRILNYSIGLAHSLGKNKYEEEALIRSLPHWSTLTR